MNLSPGARSSDTRSQSQRAMPHHGTTRSKTLIAGSTKIRPVIIPTKTNAMIKGSRAFLSRYNACNVDKLRSVVASPMSSAPGEPITEVMAVAWVL